MKFRQQKNIDKFKKDFIAVGGDPKILTSNEEYIEYLKQISEEALLDELKHGLLPELCEIEIKKRSIK